MARANWAWCTTEMWQMSRLSSTSHFFIQLCISPMVIHHAPLHCWSAPVVLFHSAQCRSVTSVTLDLYYTQLNKNPLNPTSWSLPTTHDVLYVFFGCKKIVLSWYWKKKLFLIGVNFGWFQENTVESIEEENYRPQDILSNLTIGANNHAVVSLRSCR